MIAVLTLLLACDQRLEVLDGQRVHGRQIRLDIDVEEREDLWQGQHMVILTSLAPELRRKGRGRDLCGQLLHWDLCAFHGWNSNLNYNE